MGIKVKAFAIDENNVELKDQEMIEVELNDAVSAMVANGTFASDSDGLFFQRQLEYIQATSYDVLYPDLKGRELLTTNTEGGEGINSITYRSYDKRGETAIIAGKATDLPRGDISGKEYSITVKTLGNAYGYSRQEIAAAKIVGMPLDSRKAEATRRSYEEKVNQLIFFGDVENNIHGIYGGPANFPAGTATRSVLQGVSGTSMHWANKTPSEIIEDLTSAVTAMYVDTKQLFRPSEIWLSVENLQLLHNTPRSETTDTSIIEWFVRNNKFITSTDQFKDINEIEGIYPNPASPSGAFAPGNGYEGITVIAAGSENMRIREPFPYVHLPVQLKGLEFEINCYGRFAGVETIRPAAIQHFLMGAKA